MWIALPGEIAAWWRLRSELSLVNGGGTWHIEGKGSELARLAFAVMDDDRISYELAPNTVEGGSLHSVSGSVRNLSVKK